MRFALENRIFDRAEALPRPDLLALQRARLAEAVGRCARVPFYRGALARAGVDPGRIAALDDLRRLPFTTKADLRDAYPLGMLAVPRSEIARVHGSSGTT